jgi:transposase-like protein
MPRPVDVPRWRALVAEFTRGKETVAAFCRRRGLKTPTFYEWRRRLSALDAADRAPAFLPVQVTPPPATAPLASGVELVLASGRRLRVERGFDPAVLAAVVAALDGAAC